MPESECVLSERVSERVREGGSGLVEHALPKRCIRHRAQVGVAPNMLAMLLCVFASVLLAAVSIALGLPAPALALPFAALGAACSGSSAAALRFLGMSRRGLVTT